MIPKIIHQIAPADKSKWHPVWHKCQQSWLKNFKDFEYKMWNDEEEIDHFVKANYQNYYDLYCDFPYKIMRINFARYCLLHYYGGIYADMDMYCYKNFYDVIKNKPLWFNQNKYCEFADSRYRIENCLIISSRGNYFWSDCLSVCKERFYTLNHLFQKDSIDKKWLVVHFTECDLFEQSKDIYNEDQINFLPPNLLNNKQDFFDESLYTKHFRTSTWVSL